MSDSATIYRCAVKWEPRADDVQICAAQMVSLASWLQALPITSGDWSARVPYDERRIICSGQSDAIRLLAFGRFPALGSQPWQPAQYYKQAYYLGSSRAWRARLAIVCGFSAAQPGVELPNSCELSVRGSLSVEELRQAMVGLIGVFRPVSGYASIDNVPRAKLVESAPTVGWLTYLSSWFGEPPVLAEPAVVSAIPRYGSLIQALPGPFDANDAEQSAALQALADTLRAGGVLRPYEDGTPAAHLH